MRHDSDRWPVPKEAVSAPRMIIIAACYEEKENRGETSAENLRVG
jgi:hypothetical protein